MSLIYGTRQWLDVRAKVTGEPWCEWPEYNSKGQTVTFTFDKGICTRIK